MATRKTIYDATRKLLYCHNPSHCLVTKGGRDILFRVIREGVNHNTTGDKGRIIMFVSIDGGYTDSPPIVIYEDDKWDVRSPNIAYDSGRDELIVTFNQTDQNVNPIAEKTDIILLHVEVDDFLGDMGTVWTKEVIASGFTSFVQTNGPVVVYNEAGTDYWGMPIYGANTGDASNKWRGKWLFSSDQFQTAPTSVDVWVLGDQNEWVVLELASGVLHGLIRNEASRTFNYTQSSDGGATWSAPADHTPLFAGSGAPYFCQLSNGSLVVTYRKWPNTTETGYRVSSTSDPLSWGTEGTVSVGNGGSNFATYCQPIIDSADNVHMMASEEESLRAFSDVFARVATEAAQVLTFQDFAPVSDEQTFTVAIALADIDALPSNIESVPSTISDGTKALVVQGAVSAAAGADYPLVMESDSAGNANIHYRHTIPASALSGTAKRIRMKVAGGVAEGMYLQNIFIGHKASSGNPYDFADGFKRLTFDGLQHVAFMEDDIELWSDWINFDFDGTKDLIVASSFARNSGLDTTQKNVSMPAGYIERAQISAAATFYGGCQTPPGSFLGPTAGRALFVTDIEFEDAPVTTELDSGWFALNVTGTADWSTFKTTFGIASLINEEMKRQGISPGFHLAGFKIYVNGGVLPVWSTDTYKPLWAIWDLVNTAITDSTNSIRVKCQLNGAEGLRPEVGHAVELGFTNIAGGVCDYPAEADVRLGVDYDSAALTGTLDLPAIGDVRDGTQFDNTTKEGTLELPTEPQVEDGVGYGTDGTELTGSLVATAITLPLRIIEIEELEVIEL